MESVLLGVECEGGSVRLRVVRGWVSAECDVGSCEGGSVRMGVVRGCEWRV